MKALIALAGAFLLAALIVVSGCVQSGNGNPSPAQKYCTYSTECDSKLQECSLGKCALKQGLCDSNSGCGKNEFCNTATDKCEFDCAQNCYDYQYCDVAEKSCSGLKPERCLSDYDCPGGLRCDIGNRCS
ncbi:MAG: hypothetical protein WC602_03600 [archaeon]